MSASKEDSQFLALLVHRGYLELFQAKALDEALQSGAELDDLLLRRMDWEPKKIERLRRTRAGEEPEFPGYEIFGRLGSGGTSDVFRAMEKKTRKPLALKVLNPRCSRDPKQLKGFVEEARLLERLEHPGLVKGYGVAKSGETYFARLDFIDGKTLLEYLDEGQAFEEDASLRIVLAVGEVLQYMAEEGFVHRDIKPGNIMLTSSGSVKLIDLGFCAVKAGEVSACDGTVQGTHEYMAPERAEGEDGDERSDIYSLGVTLFHLVSGRLPFEGKAEDRDAVLEAHVTENLKAGELKGRKLSPHLHYIVERMMAKDPGDRHQTWDELLADIRAQIEGRETLDYGREARTRSGIWRRPSGRRR